MIENQRIWFGKIGRWAFWSVWVAKLYPSHSLGDHGDEQETWTLIKDSMHGVRIGWNTNENEAVLLWPQVYNNLQPDSFFTAGILYYLRSWSSWTTISRQYWDHLLLVGECKKTHTGKTCRCILCNGLEGIVEKISKRCGEFNLAIYLMLVVSYLADACS